MKTLMARRLGSRILGYADDASKLATMKQNVDDVINQLQLGIVVAVGHGVDVMRQDQSLMFEDQRQMNQDQRIAIREQEERDNTATEQRTQQQLWFDNRICPVRSGLTRVCIVFYQIVSVTDTHLVGEQYSH
ncbi:hypothetical protein FRB94_007961 [Tulasnella sp. JGI-2019a]|nr:hypothetical protein FRB94_007961 [Tulasnella sp. JGI-2019a]